MIILKKIINHFLMRASVSHVKKDCGRVVYLTFDDGPEPEITEFVLNELYKYGFKATFFCKGENAEKYPDLVKEIINRGHMIGNHSYSHHHAYQLSSTDYVKDIEKADGILHSHLFRPPNGCLLFSSWLILKKKYQIVYWSVASGDWKQETLKYEECMEALKKTKVGDIVLFHFSNQLAKGTYLLLPDYLKWLNDSGFTSEAIPNDIV